MPVVAGFGVNYIAQSNVWTADQVYFKKIGLNIVRIRPPQIIYPWALVTATPYNFDFMREMAVSFQNAGFYTIFGPAVLNGYVNGSGQLTSATWPNFHDAVVAEATYLQSQGIILSEFSIANELGDFIDGTTLTFGNLYTNIKQLAADVAAAYSGRLTYGMAGGEYNYWKGNGMGSNLYNVSYHPYAAIDPVSLTINYTYQNTAQIAGMQSAAALNGKAYISEFNIDYRGPQTLELSAWQNALYMSNYYGNYIANSGSTKNLVFGWRSMAGGDSSNQFAMLYANGSMNPAWFNFFMSAPTYFTPRGATASRSSIPSRASAPSRPSTPTRYLVS